VHVDRVPGRVPQRRRGETLFVIARCFRLTIVTNQTKTAKTHDKATVESEAVREAKWHQRVAELANRLKKKKKHGRSRKLQGLLKKARKQV
jgi:hypothetical protein